ncbi:hypothetical protein CRX72_02825 [Pantoea sp. BRM17]|nr:hypothetical protein CRX72_02825 [Pantoea sp. BRM17]
MSPTSYQAAPPRVRLGHINHLHKRTVDQAGFAVLKAPDIPSILVETAFISNVEEERKLRTARYQHQVAEAIFHGIKAYFDSSVFALSTRGATSAAARFLAQTQNEADLIGGVSMSGDRYLDHTMFDMVQRQTISDSLKFGKEVLARKKDIVLKIGRYLRALIDKEHNMKAYMTRNEDVFIPLRVRVAKARKQRADLFVSIHADAFTSRAARGHPSQASHADDPLLALLNDYNKGDLERDQPAQAPLPGKAGRDRPIIIMIDPGHGGEDPGAHGKYKTRNLHINPALKGINKLVRTDDPFIKTARVGQFDPHTVRIVLELKRNVAPKTFTLAPVAGIKNRLVVDL